MTPCCAPLLRALRTVGRCDSIPERIACFGLIARSRPHLSAALQIYDRALSLNLKGAALAVYAFGSFLRAQHPGGKPAVISVSFYPNEHEEARRIAAIPGVDMAALRLGWFAAFALEPWIALVQLVGRPTRFRRCFTLLRRIAKRYHFVPACRVASTLGYYWRLKLELHKHSPHAVFVASASNPEAVASVWAGRSLGIKSVFSSHAIVPPVADGPFAPAADLILIDSQASLENCKGRIPKWSKVVLRGVVGESRPLKLPDLSQPGLCLGIFLSGMTHLPALQRLTADAAARFPSARIVIRQHPNPLSKLNLADLLAAEPRLEVQDAGLELAAAIERTALVISGNSTVHLDVLKRGIPSLIYQGLDLGAEDYLGLVRHRIVPCLSSIDELSDDMLHRFFSNEWPSRFRYFDFTYLAPEGRREQIVSEAVLNFLNSIGGGPGQK